MGKERQSAGRRLRCLCSFTGLAVLSCLHVSGQNHLHEVTKESEDLIRIREVASVHAKPDTAYLLMRVESGSVSLTQAIQDNERQISSFLEGLDGIGFEKAAIGVRNFVVTPQYSGSGVSLARNLIIPLEGIDRQDPAKLEELFAEVQDLGARYGSHCVTCIGSG